MKKSLLFNKFKFYVDCHNNNTININTINTDFEYKKLYISE